MDLKCDLCENIFMARSTWVETEMAARHHGWRIWRWRGDEPVPAGDRTVVLCPEHVGKHHHPRKTTHVEQERLF